MFGRVWAAGRCSLPLAAQGAFVDQVAPRMPKLLQRFKADVGALSPLLRLALALPMDAFAAALSEREFQGASGLIMSSCPLCSLTCPPLPSDLVLQLSSRPCRTWSCALPARLCSGSAAS